MNEIVKYHNDLHKLSMGRFTELEQNLLFSILVKCREQQDNIEIELKADELMSFVNQRKNTTKNDLLNIISNLRDNFFKLDFKVIKQHPETQEVSDEYYNLFSYFKIFYYPKSKELSRIVLKVNNDFAFILYELAGLYTQFELEEFIFLKGKYSKILYRLLKQFRVNGYMIMRWQDFKDKLAIPATMSASMIEKQILKPAVIALSETIKTNLFDARIPFEKLNYKLIKQKSQRGKAQVTHIEFFFKSQPASVLETRQKELNAQKAKQIQAQPQEPHYIKKIRELCENKAIFLLNDKFYYLDRIINITEKYEIHLQINLLERVLPDNIPYGVNSYSYQLKDDGQALDFIKSCEDCDKHTKSLEKKLLEQINK